jgi:hypothetical protein
MIDAAAEEMQREIPKFLPLGLVLTGLLGLFGGLVVATIKPVEVFSLTLQCSLSALTHRQNRDLNL